MKIKLLLLLIFLPWSSAYAADLNFAIIGDAGKRTDNSNAVKESIKRAGVYDLVLPGDNLYDSTYTNVWSGWINDGFRFAVTAIGNHNGGYAQEINFFQMPAEYYAKQMQSRVRFIVLNSDNEGTATDQARFLEDELDSATEPFIFLVYHHPTYTLSHFHNWTEKRNFQLAVRPIIANHRNKITAILVGHDHLALLAHFGDIPVIVSGAVWDTRADTPINNVQDGVSVATQWFYDRRPYWAKIVIPEQGDEAIVRYIRAGDDTPKCSATIRTGERAMTQEDCGENFTFWSIIRRFFI